MVDWRVLGSIGIFVGFIIIITCSILYSTTGGKVPFDFGIIMDAGSSHTGVSLYQWSADKKRHTGLVKQIHSAESRGGGISQYYNDLDNMTSLLLSLVNDVSKDIPKSQVSKTPLYLGATAGMRLLELQNKTESDMVIRAIKTKFYEESDLSVQSVGIISGENEGLFSWITTNYLLNKLQVDDENSIKTAAMLDMGGASAQIALPVYSHNYNSVINTTRLRLFGYDHNVTASSNLCYGVDEARHRHYALLINDDNLNDPCLPINSTITVFGNQLNRRPCLKTKSFQALYNPNKNYTITGLGDPDNCSKLVYDSLINYTLCNETFVHCYNQGPYLSENVEVIAISAYFYTLKAFNLMNRHISKYQFINDTRKLCSLSADQIEKEFTIDRKYVDYYCFQANYIFYTLENIYKLPGNWSNIRSLNEINKNDLGWSLGYIINATNAIPSEKPSAKVIETLPFVIIIILAISLISIGIYFLRMGLILSRQEMGESYQPIHDSSGV